MLNPFSLVWHWVTPWTVACQAPLFIFQARIFEWLDISFSRGSSWSRDQTRVSCIAGRFLTIWATREAHIMYTPIRILPPHMFANIWYFLSKENKYFMTILMIIFLIWSITEHCSGFLNVRISQCQPFRKTLQWVTEGFDQFSTSLRLYVLNFFFHYKFPRFSILFH